MSEQQAVTAETGWVDVMGAEELRSKGKLGTSASDVPLMLVWLADEDRPVAFHDICIHKQRNLHEGVILNGRIVCPGHQWSYDLDTGYCAARERYQPTYRAEVVDGRVHVDISAPIEPPPAPQS